MRIITDEFLLNSIQYEYIKTKGSPRKAHKNISEMMISETIRHEISYKEPRKAQFVHYLFGSISLLRNDEWDISIEAIPFETVEDVFDLLDDGNTDRDGLMEKVKREKIELREVKKWAYTFIWTTIPRGEETHPFTDLSIVLGFGALTIFLINWKSPLYKLKYVESESGTMLWIDDSVQFIRAINFDNLAASEFTEIAGFSMNKKTLNRLRFDIEPWKEGDPLEYHKPFFFHKIKRWMIDESAKNPERLFSTKSFFMKFYPNNNTSGIPFDIRCLQPNVLKTVKLRLWLNEHIPRLFNFIHNYFNGWYMTPQWRGVRILDIRDTALHWLIPDIRFCHTVRMYAWTQRHVNEVSKMFMITPQRETTTILTKINFFPELGRSEILTVTLPIKNEKNRAIQMTINRHDVKIQIRPLHLAHQNVEIYMKRFKTMTCLSRIKEKCAENNTQLNQ